LADYNFRTVSVALFAIYLILAVLSSGLTSGGPPIEMREEFFVKQSSASASYLNKFRSDFNRYEDYLELIIDTPAPSYNPDFLTSRTRREHLTSMFKWATVGLTGNMNLTVYQI
jgi:hypothetical protein